MGNKSREPGKTDIESMAYLAANEVNDESALSCGALIDSILVTRSASTRPEAAKVLKNVLKRIVETEVSSVLRVARTQKLTKRDRYPLVAAGELLGLVPPDVCLSIVEARGDSPAEFKGRLPKEPKRVRQARASVWMGVNNKYYGSDARERELLQELLAAFKREISPVKEGVGPSSSVDINEAVPSSLSPSRGVPTLVGGHRRSANKVLLVASLLVIMLVGTGVTYLVAKNSDDADSSAGDPGSSGKSSDQCATGENECLAFSIKVETDLDRVAPEVPIGAYYFESGTFESLPDKPGCGSDGYALQEWAYRHDAIPVGVQHLRLSITAKDQPILVNFAEVEAEPMNIPPGDVANCQDGGQIQVRYLDVNLDNRTTLFYSEFDTLEGASPEALALNISPGESEVLVVSALAKDNSMKWTLRLGMNVGGSQEEYVVQDGNHPFVLAGVNVVAKTTYISSEESGWSIAEW